MSASYVAFFVGGPLDGERRQIENPSVELCLPQANLGERGPDLICRRRARFRMIERPSGEYRYDYDEKASTPDVGERNG